MLCTLALGACTPGGPVIEDPKHRLTDYISKSFAVQSPQDREALAAYMTGEAKNRLLSWSDEQFRAAFIDFKRTFVKLVIREIKNASPKEVGITYELTYLDQNRGKDAKVTNKKLAQLVLDNGKWFINDVRNIKETVEYRNEMSLP
jgi:hypothetical protein